VLGPARAGRKVVLTGDTRPARSVLEMAIEADVLVHEATFGSEERQRAEETGHSTAADAAELARLAGVRLLALTHLSNRYFGGEILREARDTVAAADGETEVVVPRDFDMIDVRFAERGGPRLLKGGALGRTAEAEGAEVATVGHGEGER
jgi:ribonuclease Z